MTKKGAKGYTNHSALAIVKTQIRGKTMTTHNTTQAIAEYKAEWQGARDYHSGIVCNPLNHGARVESAWADRYRSGYDRARTTDQNSVKYIRVVRWARRRCTDDDGAMILFDGHDFTDYVRVERAAWEKWMAGETT